MSFITKRDRVFNEYDLFDLPARNEGKIKAYSSCTDARAWSHFCSDKSDHLVEIIKRNNETCRPKYIPTDVIVNTLMGTKNAEINRLKRKIEEFEQLLAAYDQLDLTPEQKNEIANAHAAIKAANKELDDLCLDLDLSGFTEGIDSEAFETGKSRGDEVGRPKEFEMETSRGTERSMDMPNQIKVTKSNQTSGLSCPCDQSTAAEDPRIEEMQDVIINKDAKLNAMRNTIAVLENDVCEPYCIYAHIYTALVKIFAVLCQNEKYKQYLDLMTSGKDIRNLDTKGKIFYKLKVLEKFSNALIAPCSKECSCYHTEITARVETAFALTSEENFKVNIDSKRAHLVADIMGNDEMKEILSSKNLSIGDEETSADNDFTIINNSSIEVQNLNRLKNLQNSYEELLICYEELKYEKDSITGKCRKYEELEKDIENMRSQLSSYNNLMNEKDFYKKRSEDLDLLKEKYLVLADETLNLETQLQAQVELNNVKSATVDRLRSENTCLQKKLNEVTTIFENEKHALICKLNECECKMMCQNQQIECLSVQINKFINENNKNASDGGEVETAALVDEINAQKKEIKNLKDSLFYKDEEKHTLRNELQEIIGNLKLEIDKWKVMCEKTIQRNEYLEKITEISQIDLQKLIDENSNLLEEVKTKTREIEGWMGVVEEKSEEISKLADEVECKKQENKNLLKQLHEINHEYSNKIDSMEIEREKALNSLKLARHDSEILLGNSCDFSKLNGEQKQSTSENTQKFDDCTNANENKITSGSILLNEIDKFRELNKENIKSLLTQSNESLKYLEQKENELLERKFREIEALNKKFIKLKEVNSCILEEKNGLVKELQQKSKELDDAKNQIQTLKIEREHCRTLIEENEKVKEDLLNVKHRHELIIEEKNNLENDLLLKDYKLQNLTNLVDKLQKEKHCFSLIADRIGTLEQRILILHNDYDNLINERDNILSQLNMQGDELRSLHNSLKVKTDENNNFLIQIKTLQEHQLLVQNKVDSLESEKSIITTNLSEIKKENAILNKKIELQTVLEQELNEMKTSYNQLKTEKENLEYDFQIQLALVSEMEEKNKQLQETATNLITYNNDIENALISTRDELQLQVSTPVNIIVDLKKEVKEIKEENEFNLQRIQNLLDKLEKSDKIIAELSEDISLRDDKISILENQVNKLGDEVKNLQSYLDTTINLGEELGSRNNEIDRSLRQMEAHHSKATHNMKIEMGKLMDQNLKLEQQLSATHIDVETSIEKKYIHLKDEREIIVTDIKQLEIRCVGDSDLSPDNCCIKSVLTSLERIGNYIDVRNKSCQLILNKAEEAKKIVEKEKQKILKEKEEAVKEKVNIQKELNILKESLEQQISKDKSVINDLEAELLNQKLIIDKINQSKESYILKLEEEIHSMEDLYAKALAKISDLELKLADTKEECGQSNNIIKRIKNELEQKCQDIKSLENMLENVKNKKFSDFETQTILQNSFTDNFSQTECMELKDTYLHESDNNTIKTFDIPNKEILPNISKKEFNEIESDKISNETMLNTHTTKINEVQILTANVEPSLGFVKNAYLRYNCEEDISEAESRGTSENGPIIILDANLSKMDQLDKELSPKSSNVDLVTSDIKISAENNLTHRNSVQSFSVIKINEDILSSRSSKNSDPSPNFNMVDNKDFITIYRDSDCDESGIDNVLESEHRNLNNEISKDSSDFSKKEEKPLNFTEQRQNLEQNFLKVKNISLLSPKGHHSSQSFSETSLLNYHTKIDNAITNVDLKNEQPNVLKKNENTLSRSYNSLISLVNNAKFKYNNGNRNNLSINDTLKNKIHIYLPRQDTISPDNGFHNKNKLDDAANKILSTNLKVEKNENGKVKKQSGSYPLEKVLCEKKHNIDSINTNSLKTKDYLHRSRSNESFNHSPTYINNSSLSKHSSVLITCVNNKIKTKDVAILVKIDNSKEKIRFLTATLENVDRDYKEKIRAIKAQYDYNIKKIMNEHNQGVQSLQNLHEETLQDLLKVHENETDNLRTMSIDAMRRVDKLEKENKILKAKMRLSHPNNLDEEPTKISSTEIRRRESKYGSRLDIKTLTKTNVEEFNVNPKLKAHGLCTCSPDINVSDTIRNIFEQVDVDQRRMAEQAYLKYIANKIITGSIEALDIQELSFLHYKICRTWKSIVRKEEVLHKRIDSLETELINKQRQTQKHIAELDRKVAEERRRLQEVREAVCRDLPVGGSVSVPHSSRSQFEPLPIENDMARVLIPACNLGKDGRLPAGDLPQELSCTEIHFRRNNREARTVPAKSDVEEGRREKKSYCDERPTRLRRSNDRPNLRSRKK